MATVHVLIGQVALERKWGKWKLHERRPSPSHWCLQMLRPGPPRLDFSLRFCTNCCEGSASRSHFWFFEGQSAWKVAANDFTLSSCRCCLLPSQSLRQTFPLDVLLLHHIRPLSCWVGNDSTSVRSTLTSLQWSERRRELVSAAPKQPQNHLSWFFFLSYLSNPMTTDVL